MSRYYPLAVAICIALLPTWASADDTGKTASKPNILLIMSDDLSFSEIGCYGAANAKTPRVDRLASQGLKFNNFYNSIAMCAPTRNMLYSGLYPMHSGSYRNHTMSRPGTKSMVQYLGKLGYRVGIAGKVHVGPQASFPFEKVPGLTPGCVSAKDDYTLDGVREFMTRDREEPFCLVMGCIQPHCPWTVGDASAYPPEKLELPPHLADTPKTRESYSKYCAEITFFDEQLGRAVDILDNSGLGENTLVLYLSEQGSQFPGAKWSCWDQGLHAAAIARWPAVIKPGTESEAVVEYVDVVPTFVEAAGGKPAKVLDGRSFLGILEGKTDVHKQYAYGVHNNCPEGPAYPIRSIRTDRFAYITNLMPDAKYIEKHVCWGDREAYWRTWEWAAADGNAQAQAALDRYHTRPAEELYDMDADPWELSNLADDPAYAEIKQTLSKKLTEWLKEQGDTGADLDVMPRGGPEPQPPAKPWTDRRDELPVTTFYN